MIAYKFLLADRVAPFTGFSWPTTEWVEAAGPLVGCRSGVHACRPEHLPYWLTDDLWEVELAGEIIDQHIKVVARKGRLLRAIEAWDEDARRAFKLACLGRTAGHAAAELKEAGLHAEAARLAQAAEQPELDSIDGAARSVALSVPTEAPVAGRLVGYVQDAVEWFDLPVSALAYVAAHAADERSRPTSDDPFALERGVQARWLSKRLQLS